MSSILQTYTFNLDEKKTVASDDDVDAIAELCYRRWSSTPYTKNKIEVITLSESQHKAAYVAFDGEFPFVLTVSTNVETDQIRISFLSSRNPIAEQKSRSGKQISDKLDTHYWIPTTIYQSLLQLSTTRKFYTTSDTQGSDATYWKLTLDTDGCFWHRCAKIFMTQWQHHQTQDFDSLVHALTSRVFST